jgi:hypothetical protein
MGVKEFIRKHYVAIRGLVTIFFGSLPIIVGGILGSWNTSGFGSTFCLVSQIAFLEHG